MASIGVNYKKLKIFLQKAHQVSKEGENARERSNLWIKSLHNSFNERFNNNSYEVFSRTEPNNDYGLSELLFDIHICKVTFIENITHGKPRKRIIKSIWQIESEFRENWGSVTKDFSKLVAGSASNKLFIGSKFLDSGKIKHLIPLAKACKSKVFLACVTQPKDWKKKFEMDFYRFGKSIWNKV
jgi:hypothetical protein